MVRTGFQAGANSVVAAVETHHLSGAFKGVRIADAVTPAGEVIADLLGVPLEDHIQFRRVLGNEVVGEIGAEDTVAHNPLAWLDDKFREYISDRRREPRADVLTELAAATYPDGAVPEPASWAMMLGGFGLVGGAMRSRRKATVSFG